MYEVEYDHGFLVGFVSAMECRKGGGDGGGF